MSETAALPLVMPSTEARALRIPRRLLKIGFAVTLMFAGAYGILSDSQYVSSSNAIVTAYVLDIRTPVDGTVTGLPLSAGIPVHNGQVLAHVENPLVDHQHLDNLRTLQEDAQSTADSIADEEAVLRRERDNLLERVQNHTEAMASRLNLQSATNERLLKAAQLALQQATIDRDRGRQLHDAGIISSSEFDKLVFAQAIAEQQTSAQEQQLASSRSQASAAVRGLLTEPGTNSDVAYSRQRADEVVLKLAETARELAASRAQANDASAAVIIETDRSAQLKRTDLRSPVNGLLWQLNAISGERSASGDSVLSLIDCNQQFLLVEIPQDRLPGVAIGHQARVRLAGETMERTGVVLAAVGDPQRDDHHKLAAFPIEDTTEQLATVRIALDPVSDTSVTCLVGRTARVLIPTQATNVVTRLSRQYF